MSSYTGRVTVGGPAESRELAELTITKLAVGSGNNNAYLLRCHNTGAQLLIDAADEADRLLELIGDGGLIGVVTTHRHHDHWQALAEVVAATGARSLAHEADAPAIDGAHTPLREGDMVSVGTTSLEVIHLVGHTPGSIALLYRDPVGPPHLFTGDNLFPGGIGGTWGNEEYFRSLMDDVEHKLFDRLPDETWFYPGHGVDSTIGAERTNLPAWRARGW